MSGVNQFYDYKGFVAPAVAPPYQALLDIAKQKRLDYNTGQDSLTGIQTRESVLPGADTQMQKAFEDKYIQQAQELAQQHAQGQIADDELMYKAKRLAFQKSKDPEYLNRLQSVGKAQAADQTHAALGKEGKLMPDELGMSYMNTEWDTKSNGIFNATPSAAVPYDFRPSWEDIPLNSTIGYTEDGTRRKMGMDRAAMESRIPVAATTMMNSVGGKQYIARAKGMNPQYAKMDDYSIAKDLQRKHAEGLMGIQEDQPRDIGSDYTTNPADPKTPTPNNDFLGSSTPAYNTTSPMYAYRDSSGEVNQYGDAFEDVDGAVNAYRRSIDKYSHIQKQADGTYVDMKTGKEADSADILELESAKNDYRLSVMNRNNILEQTANMINAKGSHIKVKYGKDDIIGENVAIGWIDVEAEKNRKLEFKGISILADRVLDAHNKHQAHPQDNEEFSFGYGSPFNNLTSEQRVAWAKAVKKDPENAYKMFKGVYTNLEPQNYYINHPSEYGKEFKTQVEGNIQQRYSWGKNRLGYPVKDNSVNILSVDQMPVDTATNPTYKSIQDSLDKGTYDGVFYDPSADGPTMPRYTLDKTWREAKRELQGITWEDIDGKGRRMVGVVRIVPKDSKGYQENIAKTVVMDLGDIQDNVMQAEFGDLAQPVKNYATQLSDIQQYGYGEKGLIATQNGNLHTRTSKDRKEIFIEERDPFTGRTTGKEKRFSSRFQAAKYLAEQDSDATMGVPTVNHYMEVLSSKESSSDPSSNHDGVATGAYGIRWTWWGDDIKDFAKKEYGITKMDREEFKKNPQLQDAYMKERFIPNLYKTVSGTNYVSAAQAYNNHASVPIKDFLDLIYLAHRAGTTGALNFLRSKNPDSFKTEDGYNLKNEFLDFKRRRQQ